MLCTITSAVDNGDGTYTVTFSEPVNTPQIGMTESAFVIGLDGGGYDVLVMILQTAANQLLFNGGVAGLQYIFSIMQPTTFTIASGNQLAAAVVQGNITT